MEAKNFHSFTSPLISQTKNYSHVTKLSHVQLKGYKRTKLWQNGQGLVMGCAKNGDTSLVEMEAKIKSEQNLDFNIEGKCRGKSGIVELMECLESEAITGEDEGKEARDYNRRARIFDKSAQVFRALKEETKEYPTDT
ncbi:Cobyrinic acid A,C-diamide synthase [Heracleum sosnowskyi]|uniref:Cobyrinic acid A,C-diamide synthase n=1 Tax=Heracleum sosnowskyi TaxID=360622 RepID=A0AAD8INN4_9APIA|nr:Cobyrinic acid A,C-diamide synthase [Heracleum sosnowskyi]